MKRLVLALPAVVVLFAATGTSLADEPPLVGTSGPTFTITLKNADGTDAKQLNPGARTIAVHDLAANHSFHLRGPGVDMATSIENLEEATWNVTLAGGTYTFLCDNHPTTMRGTVTVGTPPVSPPPVRKLLGTVGPGKKISLDAKNVSAGTFAVTVRDRTRTDNFHLIGPGVNRKTGVPFRGTLTWKVKLVKGVYRYRSDRHPGRHGKLLVT
jgi:hypothetical protein